MEDLMKILVEREAAARTERHEDPVIQRVLGIVGQPLNPIQVIDRENANEIYKRTTPYAPSPNVEAFRAPHSPDPNIYVVGDGEHYRGARKRPNDALKQLQMAATLVHEQIHNTDDEYTARRKEADFLESKMSTLPKYQQRELRKYIDRINDIATLQRD